MKTSQILLDCLVFGIEPVTESHTAEVKITASDAAAYDNFGVSVAISGDTAIVGARYDDDAGGNSGATYIFVRNGTSWTQQAKLAASDTAAGDEFGLSVAVSGDTAIVGARYDDDAGDRSGSAYIFVRNGTSWTQQAKLTASDAAAGNEFGVSVAISGEVAIVGAWRDDDAGDASGSAYIFVRSGTSWTQQSKLIASNTAAYDNFGVSVAISGDTAIIGAFVVDFAYIFVRNGTSWIQQAKLTASDAVIGNGFGESVSISGDTAIVGAVYDDDAGGNSGATYIFVRSGTSWTQQTKLTASDTTVGDWFGCSVAISGEVAIVGAWRDDDAGDASGSAYIFVRNGNRWIQQAKLTASDAAENDIFGASVAINRAFAIVGVYGDDHARGSDSGSAYIYHSR